jgi:glycosyl transferase family 25
MYNCIYINLDERTDRKAHFESQFSDLSGTKLNIMRFSAEKRSPGYIGCALSHINSIKIAKEKGWDSVIIFEDDFERLISNEEFIKQIEYLHEQTWDVCILAGVVYTCYCYDKNAKFTKAYNAQTATGYIVRKHYYDILIDNFTVAYNNLSVNSSIENYRIYAIDQHWKQLQQRDNWIISIPLLGKQYANYSNIENAFANYDELFYGADINRHIMPPRNTTS